MTIQWPPEDWSTETAAEGSRQERKKRRAVKRPKHEGRPGFWTQFSGDDDKTIYCSNERASRARPLKQAFTPYYLCSARPIYAGPVATESDKPDLDEKTVEILERYWASYPDGTSEYLEGPPTRPPESL